MRRDPIAVARARELRQNANAAETRVWWMLRAKKMFGHKFRRQHPIGPYVVDFVCLQRRLVVEIDGDTHDEGRRELDEVRTKYLNKLGFHVIRFWNSEVFNHGSDVAAAIAYELDLPLSPTLSPDGEKECV